MRQPADEQVVILGVRDRMVHEYTNFGGLKKAGSAETRAVFGVGTMLPPIHNAIRLHDCYGPGFVSTVLLRG
jgi:hypothetical protein